MAKKSKKAKSTKEKEAKPRFAPKDFYVKAEKTPPKLVPKSPLPLAWVIYGILTFTILSFCLPLNDAKEGGVIWLVNTFLILMTIISFAVSTCLIFFLRALRYCADEFRSKTSFFLVYISVVTTLLALGGALTVGRNPDVAYLVQFIMFIINSLSGFIIYIKIKKQNLGVPVLSVDRQKPKKYQRVLTAMHIVPIIGILLLFGTLLFVYLIGQIFH